VNEEQRDLVAGEALGALGPDDRERLRELLEDDPSLAAELEAQRATVAALEAGLERATPPAGLAARTVAAVAEPAPVTELRRPSRRRSLLAAAAIVAVVAFAAVLVADGGRDEPDARAAVAGTARFGAVRGEARLYRPDASNGVLVLDLHDVPAPPRGHHYEVWVLRAEGEGEMEAVGAFTPARDAVTLRLPLPGPGRFAAVDVSLEPDGGPADHSGVSLAGGRFR
jgi:anti-sigma-K factor RskA